MRNLERITLALAFLATVVTTLSTQAMQLIESRSMRVVAHTLLIRKDITGGGSNYDLIDANTKQINGVSTIDGNKLATGRVFVFDRVAVGYSSPDSGTALAANDYSTALPAALRNANIVVIQNGKEQLNIPVADCIAEAASNEVGTRYLQLPGFSWISDRENFQIQIQFPGDGASLAAGTGKINLFELRLQGVLTNSKPS